ncbi:hypothetical protein [Bizionia paragorgiae]|uniref:hypothetical protein n=1 Tax=Bizionia paragorgiae TaxID=283786 RepID=UPI003A924613
MANTTGQKFGGRSKGTPNRTTVEIRERFQMLLDNNLEKIQADLDTLEPKDRLQILLQLTKFVLPTLKATNISAKEDETIQISFYEPLNIPDIGNRKRVKTVDFSDL